MRARVTVNGTRREIGVHTRGRRAEVFHVDEAATWLQDVQHLGVEEAFPGLQVVDRESGHDEIERADVR